MRDTYLEESCSNRVWIFKEGLFQVEPYSRGIYTEGTLFKGEIFQRSIYRGGYYSKGFLFKGGFILRGSYSKFFFITAEPYSKVSLIKKDLLERALLKNVLIWGGRA